MNNHFSLDKNRKAIIVFLKYPELGKVKTRLARSIGDAAVDVYGAMVKDLLFHLKEMTCPVFFFFTPEKRKNDVCRWLGVEDNCIAQHGSDLGERIIHAFNYVFEKGYEQVTLIGSDSPELNRECMYNAFETLKKHNVVIGPAKDGGYYLIGFQKQSFSPLIFENILWSTSEVLEKTKQQCTSFGLSIGLLESLSDIDTIDDVIHYLNINKNTLFAKTHTYKLLNSLNLGEKNA